MTAQTVASAAYIVAALLFILALAGLSRHETARVGQHVRHRRHGDRPGRHPGAGALPAASTRLGIGLLVAAVLIGAAIGLFRAARVPMTGMPELIALFHSFVGLAAVLVGWNGYLEVEARGRRRGRPPTCWASTTPRSSIGVFIGAVTFTGSIVAWGKLNGAVQLGAAGAARQERR